MNIVQKIMASAVSEKVKERRNRVFLGPLPPDFLRISASVQQQQEAADRQAALALHQQYVGAHVPVPNMVGRLSITVVQAKLAKNYGFTRMDPYVRIRVGHIVYETHTDQNGGKNPKWNEVIQSLLPQGLNTIHIQIYDERSFVDELIASTQITIPRQVLAGETHDEWYQLSGKQGEGLEGMIHLILSHSAVASSYMYQQPVMIVPSVGGNSRGLNALPVVQGQQPPNTANPTEQVTPVISESELKQIEEMFPNIDKEVIKSVFEANRGNKDGTVNSLLQMCE